MAVREIDTEVAAQSQLERNPIGAVGLVLSNVSAGLRGQELPTTGLRREQAAQKDQELRQLGLTLQYAEQTVDMFSGVDRNDPEVAGQLGNWIAHVEQFLPGIKDVVTASFELSDSAGRNALRNAGDYAEFLQRDCPGLDGNCMKDALANPKIVERYDEEIDQNNLPAINDKFRTIAEAVGGDEELRRIMGEDEKWSVGELRQLPPPFNFTESQLTTISRNKDIQSQLIPFGLEPPGVTLKAAEARATEADPTIVRLQRQRDDAIRTGDIKAAQEIQDEIDKRGAIVGRTPEDVALTGERPKDIAGIRENVRSMEGDLEQLSGALKAFQETPEAAGILGTLIETGGGILRQIPIIGKDIANILVDEETQKKVKEARTKARFVTSSLLATITKETAGRFTDTERKLAAETLAALEATSDPLQVEVAMKTAIGIMQDTEVREVQRLLSVSKLDLTNSDDQDKFGAILVENGFTPDRAVEVMVRLLARTTK